MYVVHARELSAYEERIEWLLLTNREVGDFGAAMLVIAGYAKRWKVEEAHRTWKSTCKVERSALADANHLEIWAAILFVVAARIERLKSRARGPSGSRPASDEFTPNELEALILLRRPKLTGGQAPTLAQAVRWIAELGGYSGSGKSRDPPGAVTLGRCLLYLAPATEVLERLKAQRKM
ncbi:MAG: hypothetical protein HYZ28_24635 [Myxococcales bacterium]|nr:hypothetical protein [Myxococcales bacterium]